MADWKGSVRPIDILVIQDQSGFFLFTTVFPWLLYIAFFVILILGLHHRFDRVNWPLTVSFSSSQMYSAILRTLQVLPMLATITSVCFIDYLFILMACIFLKDCHYNLCFGRSFRSNSWYTVRYDEHSIPSLFWNLVPENIKLCLEIYP